MKAMEILLPWKMDTAGFTRLHAEGQREEISDVTLCFRLVRNWMHVI